MVGTDPLEVDRLLAGGGLCCPDCGGELRPWGRARERGVRDEASAALSAGHLTVEDITVARVTGEAILEDFDGFIRDIGDWRSFRPPAKWSPLPLPSDWAS